MFWTEWYSKYMCIYVVPNFSSPTANSIVINFTLFDCSLLKYLCLLKNILDRIQIHNFHYCTWQNVVSCLREKLVEHFSLKARLPKTNDYCLVLTDYCLVLMSKYIWCAMYIWNGCATLGMPALSRIERGNVLIHQNSRLCGDTANWHQLIPKLPYDYDIAHSHKAYIWSHSRELKEASASSTSTTASSASKGHDQYLDLTKNGDTDLCHRLIRCPSTCPGRSIQKTPTCWSSGMCQRGILLLFSSFLTFTHILEYFRLL